MSFEKYEPDFKDANEIREALIREEFFQEDLSIRSVILALEVLSDRHGIGKNSTGYEIEDDYLPVITQYIDRDTTIPCSVDVS